MPKAGRHVILTILTRGPSNSDMSRLERPSAPSGQARPSAPPALPGLPPDESLARAVGIAAAETIETAWQRFVTTMRDFGFERVNYGYTRYRIGQSIGDPADAMFLSTHALEQVIRFHTSGTYLHSADYRWTRDNVGACSWGWVHAERAAGRLSPQEIAVMDRLGRGRAGYTVSFPVGAPRSKGALGLAAARQATQDEVDAHWAAHHDALMTLAQMAHLKLSQLPLPVATARLTDRQRECLQWIADGKTQGDIVTITGMRPSTVERHLRLARDTLRVETTAQAVAKLAFLNQLWVTQLDESPV